MKRAAGKSHCPINFGLEAFGDPWSLLVIRDIVYFGKHTFNEFLQSDEAVSPAVLSTRLDQLQANGLVERHNDRHDRRRVSYRLTERGLALIPVLLEIANWSASADPDTDAPPSWIAAVKADTPAMVRLITDTVRDGGSVFVGDDSVLATLSATTAPTT